GIKLVSVVIWTTTPWTLPANQAVCLHGEIDYAFVQVGDEVLIVAEKLLESVTKACQLEGARVFGVKKGREGFEGIETQRPLTTGLSPILLGDFVTLDQGTGCVHIAPGHGMEDYILVLDHNAKASSGEKLEILAPVDNAGRFTDVVKEFAGQHVLKANPKIVEFLQSNGRLLGQGSLSHSYPHCWRCKNPVIFRATEQWFVSMETNDLRKEALAEIGRVQWIPAYGRDRINGMIENRPDWCLSRQRVWGVPIPGFTCTGCRSVLADPIVIEHIATLMESKGADVWFDRSAAELLPKGTTCPKCGGTDFEKERDILDVWFESGVSYAAVLKGRKWWPADLYLEGSDQHRGWFHSALLAGVVTDHRAPYKSVLTHGFVLDGQGKKMSKSAGNVVAPQDVIKHLGAEILRLWVAAQDYREDVRISQDILNQLVEVYRKIRNTCRFMLSNLYDFNPDSHRVSFDQLPELDRWALLKLHNLIEAVKKSYEDFDFRQIIHELDYFCAVYMSAVYLDILKDRLYTFRADDPLRRGSQTVLFDIVVALAKLMAPVLSFTAEEIWRALPERLEKVTRVLAGASKASVHLSQFPEALPQWQDLVLAQRWEVLLEVRVAAQAALEDQRREKVVGSSLEADIQIQANPEKYEFLKRYEADLPTVLIVSRVELREVHNLPLKPDFLVVVSKSKSQKCERCWNYRPAVGTFPDHPTLCDRCVEAVQ
ncbi:MAG TPA: isoleucine--tRNA ligase, partial [Nitrospiraceae bacterium]|nr:isoleucine--tRNA ligase [Nitrospiraceae bacterium]